MTHSRGLRRALQLEELSMQGEKDMYLHWFPQVGTTKQRFVTFLYCKMINQSSKTLTLLSLVLDGY